MERFRQKPEVRDVRADPSSPLKFDYFMKSSGSGTIDLLNAYLILTDREMPDHWFETRLDECLERFAVTDYETIEYAPTGFLPMVRHFYYLEREMPLFMKLMEEGEERPEDHLDHVMRYFSGDLIRSLQFDAPHHYHLVYKWTLDSIGLDVETAWKHAFDNMTALTTQIELFQHDKNVYALHFAEKEGLSASLLGCDGLLDYILERNRFENVWLAMPTRDYLLFADQAADAGGPDGLMDLVKTELAEAPRPQSRFIFEYSKGGRLVPKYSLPEEVIEAYRSEHRPDLCS